MSAGGGGLVTEGETELDWPGIPPGIQEQQYYRCKCWRGQRGF